MLFVLLNGFTGQISNISILKRKHLSAHSVLILSACYGQKPLMAIARLWPFCCASSVFHTHNVLSWGLLCCPYVVSWGLTFLLCFYLISLFFLFHFFSETRQPTKTKIWGGRPLPGRNWSQISVRSVEGFWMKRHFAMLIIDSLTYQQPWANIHNIH